MGFRKFSIHKPSARQHPYDQTFQDMQRQLDNISSQNNYINVYVNGERWGIMNIEICIKIFGEMGQKNL